MMFRKREHVTAICGRWVFLGRALCVLVALWAAASPVSAQLNPTKLTGEVADEEGDPVGGIVLLFVPAKDTANVLRKVKVNKKGRFAHAFFPSGRYTLEVEGDDWGIRKVEAVLKDATNIEVDRWELQAHPEKGVAEFRLPAGHKVHLKITVIDRKSLQQWKQELSAAEKKNELDRITALYQQGDMEGVIQEADRLLQEKPDLGFALFLRGVAYQRKGELEKAEADLQRASELVPEQPGIWAMLGMVRLNQGDALREAGDQGAAKSRYLEAADLFQKELDRHPDDTAALTNLAAALERAGALERLQPVLEMMIEREPNNPEPYFHLARIYTERGEEEKAVALLENVPVKDREAAVRLFNLAVRLYNENRFDQAYQAATRVQQIAPDLPNLYYLLARIHLAQDRFEEAKAAIRKFLELAPDDPKAPEERKLLDALEKRGS